MSKLNEILTLEPPTGLNYSNKERMTGKPVDCPVCNGCGGWSYNESDPEYYETGVFKECYVCKGTGKIRPVITIEWV